MTKAITPKDLTSRGKLEDFALIDVRETDEFNKEHIQGSLHIPLAQFLADPKQVKSDKPIIFICRSGRRSEIATQKYLSNFPDATAFNLTGGLLAWRADHLPLEENHDMD